MAIAGLDDREIQNNVNADPFDSVVAVDIRSVANGRPATGSGIVIGPDHVLTAGHVFTFNEGLGVFRGLGARVTLGQDVSALPPRTTTPISASDDNAATTGFIALIDGYDGGGGGDDIGLISLNRRITDPSRYIGLVAFVDPADAIGLEVTTAGYPALVETRSLTTSKNEPFIIRDDDGNPSEPINYAAGAFLTDARTMFTSTGTVDTAFLRGLLDPGVFSVSSTVDIEAGQSGSGYWTILDGDSQPRVMGVVSYQIPGADLAGITLLERDNFGALITTEVYDDILVEMAALNITTPIGNDLPENAIIGSSPGDLFQSGDDYIIGSYPRERIIGQGGDDRLFGGGADDRLEGGDGVDQALFSGEFKDYDFKIIDPGLQNLLSPAVEFDHVRGSQADGKDTTKDIEFGVFEFDDDNRNGIDDDGELFFVPLQVDPKDDTKLKDGPMIKPEEVISFGANNPVGKITIESPAWMFDGDVDYTLTIDGSEQFGTNVFVLEFLDRIEVILGETLIDTITTNDIFEKYSQLSDSERFSGKLVFERTIEDLEVSRTAENNIIFDVFSFGSLPLTPSIEYKITTGQEQVTTQTRNGTKEITTFGVNQSDFVTPSGAIAPRSSRLSTNQASTSQILERDIVGNDLNNTIEVQSGTNSLFGNGGSDRFILLGGNNAVDGGEGIDTVQLNQTQTAAGPISIDGDIVNIGADTSLTNVEFIEFSDVRLAVDTLAVTPILSLANSAIQIEEGDAGPVTALLTVNLSSAGSEDVVINYATRAQAVTAGADFTENISQLIIPAGDTSGDITIEILGDTDPEGNEALFVDLTAVSGGTFSNGVVEETAIINILDDDSIIFRPLTGELPTVVEGSSDSTPTQLFVGLTRFGSLSETDVVEVQLVPLGNTPAQAADFVGGFSSQQITFNPGESEKTVEVSIVADQEAEANEAFGLRLNPVSGSAFLASEDIVFTILDDDLPSLGNAPIAVEDSFTTDENVSLNGNVLLNDTDADGDTLSATLISTVSNGNLNFESDGSFTYTPNPNFSGSDSFTYEANDGNNGTDTGLVIISVTTLGNAPVAVDDSFTTDENVSLNGNVLLNDTDADGDTLSATLISTVSNGNLNFESDGSFTYTPNPNFSGSDSFTYEANDGNNGTDTGLVTISVISSGTPSVLDIGLYDADTNTLIRKIEEGDEIIASTLGENITIAAFVPDDSSFADQAGSILLNLNGGQVTRTENIEPYVLFGDREGDFRGGDISIGNNTISLDVYSEDDLKGDLLGTVNRNFTIVDDISGSAELDIRLYDADNDTLIGIIREGDQILASTITGRNVTIAAFLPDDSLLFERAESMFIDLNDGQVTQTENIEPYALFGDSDGDFGGGSIAVGDNTISFDVYSRNRLKGDLLATITRNFEVVNDLV